MDFQEEVPREDFLTVSLDGIPGLSPVSLGTCPEEARLEEVRQKEAHLEEALPEEVPPEVVPPEVVIPEVVRLQIFRVARTTTPLSSTSHGTLLSLRRSPNFLTHPLTLGKTTLRVKNYALS